jgi:hypothetical protein
MPAMCRCTKQKTKKKTNARTGQGHKMMTTLCRRYFAAQNKTKRQIQGQVKVKK